MRNLLAGLEYESAGAEFDEPDRVYRYRLWRRWGVGTLSQWRTVLWVMLNPSTADENVLDPTLRRCQSFSRAWGYDGFEVVNMFGLRATNPNELLWHPDPVGAGNWLAITGAAQRADLIVCGWGSHRAVKAHREHIGGMFRDIKMASGKPTMCLWQNADGQPQHPLYLAGSTPLKEFSL